MDDREPLVRERVRLVLRDLAAASPPDVVVADRFDTGPPLTEEDAPEVYAAVAEIVRANPDAAPLADRLVYLADELVLSTSDDRPGRIECALALYAVAAEVYPKQEEPLGWAHVASRVAFALTHRVAGDRAENVETAQQTARAAVEVAATTEDLGLQAQAHSVLGSALLEGDDPGQFDLAREAFEAAAHLYRREGDVEGWAEAVLDGCVAVTEAFPPTSADELAEAGERCAEVMAHAADLPPRLHAQAALAAAKVALARGESGATEHAIGVLETALDGLGDDVHPATEAKVHVNLGVAYGVRLLGDPEENAERALQAFLTARGLFGPSFPVDAALVDLNLAAAYNGRVLGDLRQNHDAAVAAARRALDAFLSFGDRSLWATASATLGQTLVDAHTMADDPFWEGIEHLQAAEAFFGETGREVERADIGVALGSLWTAAPTPMFDHGVQMLLQAASSYDHAGEGYRWGTAACALGHALGTAPPPHQAPDPEGARRWLRDVLERLPLDLYADLRLRAALTIGRLAADEGNAEEALDAHRHAADAAWVLAAAGFDDPRRAHEMSERAWPVFGALARAAVEADDAEAGALAAGLARSLAVQGALGSDRAIATLPQPLQEAVRALRARMAAFRHDAFGRASVDGLDLRGALRPARGRLRPPTAPDRSDVADRWLAIAHEAAVLQREVDRVAPSLQVLPLRPPAEPTRRAATVHELDPEATVLDLLVAPDGVWLGWTTPEGSFNQRWAGADARDALVDLDQSVPRSGASRWSQMAWASRLPHRLSRLSRALGLDEIVGSLPPESRSLAVLPHRESHGIPFAALPVQDGVLADRFDRGIAVLAPLPLARPPTRPTDPIRAPGPLQVTSLVPPIGAPSFAGAELDLGGTTYTSVAPATVGSALGASEVLHVAAHGRRVEEDPLAAVIDLGEGLTFGATGAYELDLSRCRLAVLASCSSATADAARAGESYAGLQTAFLAAGARAVIAALWSVDDAVAAILLGRLYQELTPDTLHRPHAALARTMDWARRANADDLLAWLAEAPVDPSIRDRLQEAVLRMPEEAPLSSPTYWASFSTYVA